MTKRNELIRRIWRQGCGNALEIVRNLPAGTFADEKAPAESNVKHRAALRGLLRAFSVPSVGPDMTDESIRYSGRSPVDMSVADLEIAVRHMASAQGEYVSKLANESIAYIQSVWSEPDPEYIRKCACGRRYFAPRCHCPERDRWQP